MYKKLFFRSCIIVGVALEIAADVFFKQWTQSHKTIFIVIGCVIYAIGTVLWAFSLKYELLSKAVIIFTLLNLIGVLIIGIGIFHEKLSLINKAGLLL